MKPWPTVFLVYSAFFLGVNVAQTDARGVLLNCFAVGYFLWWGHGVPREPAAGDGGE